MTEETGVKQANGSKPWVHLRRKLRTKANKKHKKKTEWRGGVLYFVGTNDFVPGVEHVPKSGKKAIGYKAARPQPSPGYERHP